MRTALRDPFALHQKLVQTGNSTLDVMLLRAVGVEKTQTDDTTTLLRLRQLGHLGDYGSADGEQLGPLHMARSPRIGEQA